MKSRSVILMLALLMCASFNSVKMQSLSSSNLVLFYDFNGNIKDGSGGSNNLTIPESKFTNNKYKWVEGRDGSPNSALQFLNNPDPIIPRLNISPVRMPEFTFTAWVYGRPYGYLLGTTLPSRESDKITSRMLLFADGKVNTGYMANYAGYKEPVNALLKSSDLPEDKWNFIALVVSAKDSLIKMYVNDEYYTPTIKAGQLKIYHTKKGGDLRIGTSQNLFSTPQFIGKVDEIRIFNVALTDEQISALSGMPVKNARERFIADKKSQEFLIGAIIAFFALSIVVMTYMLFSEKKFKLISDSELQSFKNKAKNLSDNEVFDNNNNAVKLVNDAYDNWTVVQDDGTNQLRLPTKYKQMVATYKALEQARKLEPSEKNVVDELNYYGKTYNDLSKRKFYGNKVLIGAALIVPIAYGLIMSKDMTQSSVNLIIILMLPIVSYILANLAPTYLVANRKNRFHGVFGGIFAAILGIGSAAMAKEYYNEITWKNGSKTVEYDTASNMMSLIFGLLMFVLAILASVILVGIAAIISFLRNYVFYK